MLAFFKRVINEIFSPYRGKLVVGLRSLDVLGLFD